MSGTITNVNVFLQSETAAGIIELQLINNSVNGKHYNYQTPVYDGQFWYVWFFADVTSWINPETLDDSDIQNMEGVYK